MPETDLFLVFIRRLNSLPFPYMVTGSIAGVLYGEPRVTHDVDLVLAMPAGPGLKRFEEAFGIDEFYCPPTEVLMQECLRRQRGHFNLIHHQSGFKADVYLANEDLFHAWALDRRRKLEVDGEEVHVAPPEYVIVRKLSSTAKVSQKSTSATFVRFCTMSETTLIRKRRVYGSRSSVFTLSGGWCRTNRVACRVISLQLKTGRALGRGASCVPRRPGTRRSSC